MAPAGAKVIAEALHELGVTVIFGLVGLPVTDIAEQAIDLGIRFIGFRNEQAASYAATAYGYLMGRPGVCLLVGGPGILHGVAGIGNASANAFPTLFLGGSSETNLWTKGGFQEMDSISLLTPLVKTAIRPASNHTDTIVTAIYDAYRLCWYGRPGPTFIDLPTDFIMSPVASLSSTKYRPVAHPPKSNTDQETIVTASNLIKEAQSPLLIIGKGAAYARAENSIRRLVDAIRIPFLPTPMGKGVVPDSHPLNASAARSMALRETDVIILLGARLNWILHYGAFPRYRKDVKIIQVDISPEELGRRNALEQPALSVFGDINLVVQSLTETLRGWKVIPPVTNQTQTSNDPESDSYLSRIAIAAARNTARADGLASLQTPLNSPLTFERAFHIIKTTLHSLSPPCDGNIVYVAEGSNTMDISRPIFPLEHPRQKLDAGTYATMGVGLAYAIAAYQAYNVDGNEKSVSLGRKKKIVALEGDSALGFAAMEIETMARLDMDVLVFCMNNSGIYHGDTTDEAEWKKLQKGLVGMTRDKDRLPRLKSSSLWHEARYEKLAEIVGGRGIFVRTEKELENATREGFLEKRVTVINVIIEPGINKSISFAWQQAKMNAKM